MYFFFAKFDVNEIYFAIPHSIIKPGYAEITQTIKKNAHRHQPVGILAK